MKEMEEVLSACRICPRGCAVNRVAGKIGWCRASYLPKVALVSKHFGEEPPISGTNGSGTVFFSHCNMGCAFCQNAAISTDGFGQEISVKRLSEIFLEQQERGLHNINLVSAVQYLPQTALALEQAKARGLVIPVVYNSNGYEAAQSLRMLEGLVDVYLPDFKYWDNALGLLYSQTPHYREAAISAITEMRRQTNTEQFDDAGILQRGLIIRHLVLPGHFRDSLRILDWIRDSLGAQTYVSLLSQYTPMGQAADFKTLSRRLTTYEYDRVVAHFFEIGLKNGFMQKRSSACARYTPIFDLSGVAEGFDKKREEK